jgi:hypothetical protein
MKQKELEEAERIIRELLNDHRINRHLLNWYQNAVSDGMLTADQFETLKKMARYKPPPQKSPAMMRASRVSKRPITLAPIKTIKGKFHVDH